jgi:deazaflavin-dependent oxidoreductase (nitroreductase family)
MNDEVVRALASDRVIDITTTGRQSGQPRRIEIWFHRLDGKYYITGTPGRPRSWYANLLSHPSFTFHLKQSATADLSATARPVTGTAEREKVLAGILASLGELTSTPGQEPAAWVAGSPLVEVVFDSGTDRKRPSLPSEEFSWLPSPHCWI